MIELKHLSAGYGGKKVLCDLSTAFEKGSLTSIIGANGCGKSTLLKSIVGLLPDTDGSLLIDGEDITQLRRREIARRVSYLAQGKDTPDMTVEQMVLHGRFPYLSYPRRYTEGDREIACAAIERMGLAALAQSPLSTLSGGVRQKAYIAMALAQNTDYILLDEPTTYLDISHQLTLMKLLRQLADEGKGIVTVMHDLPMTFTFSDGIAVMRKGKIALAAPPDAVSESPLIREIFGVSVKREPSENRYLSIYVRKQKIPRCGEASGDLF